MYPFLSCPVISTDPTDAHTWLALCQVLYSSHPVETLVSHTFLSLSRVCFQRHSNKLLLHIHVSNVLVYALALWPTQIRTVISSCMFERTDSDSVEIQFSSLSNESQGFAFCFSVLCQFAYSVLLKYTVKLVQHTFSVIEKKKKEYWNNENMQMLKTYMIVCTHCYHYDGITVTLLQTRTGNTLKIYVNCDQTIFSWHSTVNWGFLWLAIFIKSFRKKNQTNPFPIWKDTHVLCILWCYWCQNHFDSISVK